MKNNNSCTCKAIYFSHMIILQWQLRAPCYIMSQAAGLCVELGHSHPNRRDTELKYVCGAWKCTQYSFLYFCIRTLDKWWYENNKIRTKQKMNEIFSWQHGSSHLPKSVLANSVDWDCVLYLTKLEITGVRFKLDLLVNYFQSKEKAYIHKYSKAIAFGIIWCVCKNKIIKQVFHQYHNFLSQGRMMTI